MSLNRRLQVLIDESRHRRISEAAAERGVSVATIVRDAIDRGLPKSEDIRWAAAQRILDAPDVVVPDPAELAAELSELRGRRG